MKAGQILTKVHIGYARLFDVDGREETGVNAGCSSRSHISPRLDVH